MRLPLVFLLVVGTKVTAQDTGFGCFILHQGVCSCLPSVCTNSTCQASGGIWNPECVSCQCEEISTDVVASIPPTADLGFGCFGLPSAPAECDCSLSVCSSLECSVRFCLLRWISQAVPHWNSFFFSRPKVGFGQIVAQLVNVQIWRMRRDSDATILLAINVKKI